MVRFRSPLEGATAWHDLVKGPISIDNAELDDLIIARPDGTPTYNFCVVADDWDMGITHVIRGDDHVNNTPRQINILRALGAEIPEYGHVPMILGPDGEKLSKRHGAVSVMEYNRLGYLPQAMMNYLARLGWSHGNDELFARDQFIEWFDPAHLSRSAAQWDPKKLNWVNAHWIRELPLEDLTARVVPRIREHGGDPDAAVNLPAVMALLRDRSETLEELAEGALLFCGPYVPADGALRAEVLDDAARALLREFHARATGMPDWAEAALDELIKALLKEQGVKMPKLAIPLRVAVTGRKHTPSIGAVLALLGRATVLERLKAALDQD
ncbi:Glutamate--tRNA ligase OS=Castellaniella defragrans OX=75697 GN=gltX PE=3 SV=1 [Castellaniella defragrans]